MRIIAKGEAVPTIDDVLVCPACGGDSYEYNTDEIDFEGDGTGHYYTDCSCKDCKTNFRLCIKFKYSITESWTR